MRHREEEGKEEMTPCPPGYADNAMCPHCKTYTIQKIVSRGQRQCAGCLAVFALKDTAHWSGRKRMEGKKK